MADQGSMAYMIKRRTAMETQKITCGLLVSDDAFVMPRMETAAASQLDIQRSTAPDQEATSFKDVAGRAGETLILLLSYGGFYNKSISF